MNIRIAYFGIGKSNTYLALKEGILNKGYEQTSDFTFKNDKNEITIFGTKDFREIESCLEQNKCDSALLPFANSDSGIVIGTFDLMINRNYQLLNTFFDEIKLRLYCLNNSVKKETLSQVKTIYTNLPVLNQCSSYINSYMPFAVFKHAASTTESIKLLKESNDPYAVCIANDTATEDKDITPVSNDVISNNGGSVTRFVLVKKREKPSLKFETKDVYKNFVGYYVYVSNNDVRSIHSVNSKSWRVVQIKENNKMLEMRGYTVGFSTHELFSSVDTSAYINKDGEASLFYEYKNNHMENSVNGFARLVISEKGFLNNEPILGKYCGFGNNKTGTLQFLKISKEEYDIYMETRDGK